MKLLLLAVAVAISVSCACAVDVYSSRYEKIDLDEILSNKRLLKGYMKCALDKGPCTPEGKELKYYIVDALKSGCEKCTDYHRKSIKKVINHLIKYENDYWRQAVEKYDSDRKYTEKYEKDFSDW